MNEHAIGASPYDPNDPTLSFFPPFESVRPLKRGHPLGPSAGGRPCFWHIRPLIDFVGISDPWSFPISHFIAISTDRDSIDLIFATRPISFPISHFSAISSGRDSIRSSISFPNP